MAWPNFGDAFVMPLTPAEALAAAEINYQHEADALLIEAQQLRLRNVAQGHAPDFHSYAGHRCVAECFHVKPPPGDLVYVCPFPEKHPQHKRNRDGSVLHRWSNVVSVCYRFGTPHLCTPNMCTHLTTQNGELVCSLTARSLGVEIYNVSELDFAFESGKAMTAVHLDTADREAIEARIESYVAARPENVSLRESAIHASEDAREIERRGTKRVMDISEKLRIRDSTRTAGAIGLLEPAPNRQLSIAERISQGPQPLSEPIVVRVPIDTQPRAHPFSALGEGPTEVDIRAHFRIAVDEMWTLLERAYNLQLRAEELRAAELQVIHRCIDKRRAPAREPRNGQMSSSSSSSSLTPAAPPPEITLQYSEIASIHTRETKSAFEGMGMVRILAGWPDWTSGKIRQECTTELSERMWKLWTVIARSPKYLARQEPHLYTRVKGAMLTMVIDGFSVVVCKIPRGEGTVYVRRCSHQKDATSVAECGHEECKLWLIKPHLTVLRLLKPDGMRRRALDPVCNHVLGNMNTVTSFITSLLEIPRSASGIRKLHIG